MSKTLDLFDAEADTPPSESLSKTDDAPDLPEGWASASIGGICQLNPGKPAANSLPADAPVSFVPMPAVDAQTGMIADTIEKPFHEVRGGYTAFAEGDVIFAKITPCMENGKSAIARNLTNGLGFGSSEFHVLRPNGVALAEYLFYFVRQEAFRRVAEENMTGSVGQARVPAEFLRQYPVPLPPLAEQTRIIAAIVEALMHVEAARKKLAHVPVLLKRFRQSVLAAACSGRLTADWRDANPDTEPASVLLERIAQERRAKEGKNYKQPAPLDTSDLQELPDTWQWTTVGGVCRVQGGFAFKSTEYLAGGVPLIRISNLIGGKVVPTTNDVFLPPQFSVKLKEFALNPGDLLMALSGATTGKMGVYESHTPALLNQRVGRFLNDPDVISQSYLRLCIALLTERILKDAYGAAQPNISPNQIELFECALPPLVEQAEIVRRVEGLFALADALEKRVAQATARVEKTTQAVLAKAFRGELVPTEAELARQEKRTYETASELLARVTTHRPGLQTRSRKQSQ